MTFAAVNDLTGSGSLKLRQECGPRYSPKQRGLEMLNPHRLVLIAVTLLTILTSFPGSVLVAQQPAAGDFAPIGSILEIMLGVVDPTADFIFESVSVVVNAAGT